MKNLDDLFGYEFSLFPSQNQFGAKLSTLVSLLQLANSIGRYNRLWNRHVFR